MGRIDVTCPLAKISMLRSLEIKGFIGGNRENETWNRNMFACFIYSFISFKSLINGDKPVGYIYFVGQYKLVYFYVF